MKFTAAKCPSCNGDLQVPEDLDFVYCMYCKSQIKVRDSLIIKNNIDPENLIELGYTAIQHRNFEEGVEHLNKVLESDIKNNKAWWGKGMACINSSGGDLFKMEEGLTYLLKANELSDDADKKIIKDNIMEGLCEQQWSEQHIDFLFKVFESFGSDDERLLIKIIDMTNISIEDTGDISLHSELSEKQEKALELLKDINFSQYTKYIDKTVKSKNISYEKKKSILESNFKQFKSLYSDKYFFTFFFTVILTPVVTMVLIQSYSMILYIFLAAITFLLCWLFLNSKINEKMKAYEKEQFGDNIFYK
ncbi:MAG TPA: hypothetical protein PK536_03680 [Ignavibacteria bacterium]|nr:hypothetical protein [Bacteroidota bacterium]HRI84525.1 hypothetical protein [Ignavibacteria bacterium]HRJ99386.1 hypothetical protein [Ignavibacteria bacterium]